MNSRILYWDDKEQCQKEREATTDEQDEIDSRLPSAAVLNAPILAQLRENDTRAVRAILEGDQERISMWNERQAELRAQLVKD